MQTSRWCKRFVTTTAVFVLWLATSPASFSLEVTGTREFSKPGVDGSVTVTLEVNVSTDVGEVPPHGIMVLEYLPAQSTVENSDPAKSYYAPETGELAWFFYDQPGVTGRRTMTYTFKPSESGGSIEGEIRYHRDTETMIVDIGSSPIPTPEATPTPTDTPTNTPTNTPLPTDTPTFTPRATDTPTNTPTYTYTPTDTPTLSPTPTDTPTLTPIVTDTPTITPTPEPAIVFGRVTRGDEPVTEATVWLPGLRPTKTDSAGFFTFETQPITPGEYTIQVDTDVSIREYEELITVVSGNNMIELSLPVGVPTPTTTPDEPAAPTPTPTLDISGNLTLVVFSQFRLEHRYGKDRVAPLLEKLNEFMDHETVRGTFVNLDISGSLENRFAQWDASTRKLAAGTETDRVLNVEKGNVVAEQINLSFLRRVFSSI